MKRGLGLSNQEIGTVFEEWNKGVLDSFLIEITRDIMKFNDDDGKPLVEKILDQAGQKGTGKWTAVNALDLGMPVTLIAESVLARCLSSIKPERIEASKMLEYRINPEDTGSSAAFGGKKPQSGSGKITFKSENEKKDFIKNLEQALYASKIISYTQGFMLMQEVCYPTPILTAIVWCKADTNFSTRPPKSTAGS